MSGRSVVKVLGILFAIFVCIPLAAADRVPGAARLTDVEVLAQFDPVAIADYRAALKDIVRMDAEIIEAMGQADVAAATLRRLQVIDQTSDADIARLMASEVDLSDLRAQTAALHQRVSIATRFRVKSLSDGLPSADYSFCGSDRNPTEAMFAAQTTLDAAKTVWAAASRACDEVIVAAGFGGNGSLACIIADTVLYAAEAVYRGLEFCDDEIDSNEIEGSYERLAHVHGDLVSAESNIISNDDGNTSTIISNDDGNTTTIVNNDNANTLTIVTNDNTNTATIVTNDDENKDLIITNANANTLTLTNLINLRADELRDLQLQIEIEENLQAGDGKQIAFFFLPAAFGGNFELAKQIVLDQMAAVIASGQSVHEAQKKVNESNVLFAAGNYKYAYKKLQEAYGELAKN